MARLLEQGFRETQCTAARGGSLCPSGPWPQGTLCQFALQRRNPIAQPRPDLLPASVVIIRNPGGLILRESAAPRGSVARKSHFSTDPRKTALHRDQLSSILFHGTARELIAAEEKAGLPDLPIRPGRSDCRRQRGVLRNEPARHTLISTSRNRHGLRMYSAAMNCSVFQRVP